MSASPPKSGTANRPHSSSKFELSVDVQERHEEEEKRRARKRAENSKNGIVEETWVEVDYKQKALDTKHIRALADLMAYLFFLIFIFCVVFLNPAEMHANKVRALPMGLAMVWTGRKDGEIERGDKSLPRCTRVQFCF
jgi:hypothetical protein